MTYRDDLTALGANHLWPGDGNLNDIIGTLNFTNSGGAFTGPQICEDAATSYVTNGTADTATAASDPSVQDVTQGYCYSFWFQTTAIQQPPCRVFGDGGQTANNSFLLGFGNSIVCEADCDPTVIQVGSSTAIVANRPYNLALVFRDIGGGSSQLEFFLDGVSQGTSDIADVMNSGRGGFAIGGATNTTTYSIGGSAFQLVSPVNGYYSMVCSLTGANVPTNAEIRSEAFEKGALPGVTIASDTEANMQIALDALASTVRPNEPLNIRIEAVTGDGTVNLTADNITHDTLASIHVQYMGTGTLNYTNTNGADASIGSTPNGGTINFINPAVLTVSPLIAGTEVRYYIAGTQTELAGVESSGTSFSSSVSASSVDVVVHSLGYQYIKVRAVDMSSGDVSVPIQQIPDPQYVNP